DRIFDDDERFTLMLLGGEFEVRPELPRGRRGSIHHVPQTTRPCDARCDRRVKNRLGGFFNILRLKTLMTLSNREFDAVAFFQGLVSVTYNSRIVHEHIASRRSLDKPESLLVIEPLHLALLFAHYP